MARFRAAGSLKVARRGEHIGHLIFLHDSGQIPAVAVITQQADPAELCCKVHLLR